jgi:hypothetical protein
LLSLFIVSAFILVVCEVAEEEKQKKIQRQNRIFGRYLQRLKQRGVLVPSTYFCLELLTHFIY